MPVPWGSFDALTPGIFLVAHHMYAYDEDNFALFNSTGVFDTAQDALAYIRFTYMPYILSWDIGKHDEEEYQDAEAYIPELAEDEIEKATFLLQQIDSALHSEESSFILLQYIRIIYNDVFFKTYPDSQILAWGPLKDVLMSPRFAEVFVLETEQDGNESVYKLRTILDSGEFDENNKDHLALAVEFLKKNEVC